MSMLTARKYLFIGAPVKPTFPSARKAVAEKTAEVIVGFFPELSSGKRASRKSFNLFVTGVAAVGFLFLLGINTLLAQDAFELSKLKLESKAIAAERESIDRAIDMHASPESLSADAAALGMKLSENPVFLNLATPAQGSVSNG